MYAVIMAGGGGTRLWPLSRSARPKPFLPLLGGRSLLEATVERVAPLVPIEDIHVVTDERYVGFVRELLPGLPPANVLAEPTGRNTAAAVAYAAAAVDRPGDAVMIVLPADQIVSDPVAFRDALAAATVRAASGDMVTLGIEPTTPATGYGYVLATGAPDDAGGRASFRVARFEEKPSQARAEELIASGSASWNAGIFVWRRDALLDALSVHAADILEPIRDALAAGADGTGSGAEADARPGGAASWKALSSVYPDLRSTSIDYALLEPVSLQGRVAVVPVSCGWSDLGSWEALLEALAPTGEKGSVLRTEDGSRIIDVGSRDVLVHAAGGRLVALIGLSDLVVVDTPDALLVCAPEAAQDVKKVVEQLAREGRRELL
jgi:mannose-1-phosphate guanylyltransferase